MTVEEEQQVVLDLRGRIGIKLADAALDLSWLASLVGKDTPEGSAAKHYEREVRDLLSEWQSCR